MGVHFTVIADHDIRDTSPDAIRSRFAPLDFAFERLVSELDLEPCGWSDLTEPGRSRSDHFYAPAGFSVLIGASALRFHHVTRFSTFAEPGIQQTCLRRFSRDLVRIFGNRRALCAPCEGIGDHIVDWIGDGLSLAEIESRLRQKGAPAASLTELGHCLENGPRYHVDAFEDLL